MNFSEISIKNIKPISLELVSTIKTHKNFKFLFMNEKKSFLLLELHLLYRVLLTDESFTRKQYKTNIFNGDGAIYKSKKSSFIDEIKEDLGNELFENYNIDHYIIFTSEDIIEFATAGEVDWKWVSEVEANHLLQKQILSD